MNNIISIIYKREREGGELFNITSIKYYKIKKYKQWHNKTH